MLQRFSHIRKVGLMKNEMSFVYFLLRINKTIIEKNKKKQQLYAAVFNGYVLIKLDLLQ